MPRFLRRYSPGGTDHSRARKFPIARRKRHPPEPAFRDNPAGPWPTACSRRKSGRADGARVTRATLADSVTVLRIPAARRCARHLVAHGPVRLRARRQWRLAAPSTCASARRVSTPVSPSSTTPSRSTCATAPTFVVASSSKVPARSPSGTAKTSADPRSSSCAQGPVRRAQRAPRPRGFRRRSRCPRTRAAIPTRRTCKDLVALGKELSRSVGCEACHRVDPQRRRELRARISSACSAREPRTREVVEGGKGIASRSRPAANTCTIRCATRRPAGGGREWRHHRASPIYP